MCIRDSYQGAWNPVAGLTDTYSTQIWFTLFDPSLTGHPFSGKIFPIRTNWEIGTDGPKSVVNVPADAIIWDSKSKNWKEVGPNTFAISKATFDLNFGEWHNGQKMNMNDIIYSTYFLLEWGSEKDENDKTFDSDYSPQAAQTAKTLVGIKPIDNDTIEVYTNYWHFDESQIASWAGIWSTTPWEIMSAMEKSVIDGKVAFSRSDAATKNISWLSLIVPLDARIIQETLEYYEESQYIPSALNQFETGNEYFESRYQKSIDWITKYDHAIISNGPFYLDRYSPESRTIVVKSFDYGDYPFSPGKWSEFEQAEFPKILSIKIDNVLPKNSDTLVPVITKNSSEIHYFVSNSRGEIISHGKESVNENKSIIPLDAEIVSKLDIGANTLKIFAASDDVLRPYEYSTSFLVSETSSTLPDVEVTQTFSEIERDDYSIFIIILIAILVTAGIIISRLKSKKG